MSNDSHDNGAAAIPMPHLNDDAAVQIHGGYGVSKEFPLERWYREARVRRIGEGPSEVHRMVIAREVLAGS